MIKAYSTKNEYEAIELFRKEKESSKFSGRFIDLEVSEKLLATAQEFSLFGEKNNYFVKVENLSDLEILNKEIVEACRDSENLFLFWGKGKTYVDFFENLDVKVFEKKEIFKNDFPAAFVTALQKKDKKNAWVLFLKEMETKNIEEVYGVCVYSQKVLLTAMTQKKFDDKSGQKEFTYKSTLTNSKERNLKDVENVYFELVSLYAKSRNENIPLESLVEGWILGW